MEHSVFRHIFFEVQKLFHKFRIFQFPVFASIFNTALLPFRMPQSHSFHLHSVVDHPPDHQVYVDMQLGLCGGTVHLLRHRIDVQYYNSSQGNRWTLPKSPQCIPDVI